MIRITARIDALPQRQWKAIVLSFKLDLSKLIPQQKSTVSPWKLIKWKRINMKNLLLTKEGEEEESLTGLEEQQELMKEGMQGWCTQPLIILCYTCVTVGIVTGYVDIENEIEIGVPPEISQEQ